VDAPRALDAAKTFDATTTAGTRLRVNVEPAPIELIESAPPATRDGNGIALTDIPVIGRLLGGRWLQWGATVITLAVFLVVILTGLFGTPAGNHNFGIIYVWLVWWALLKLVLIPLFGRFWCSVCPIPAPGDWIQRRSIVTPRPGGKLCTYAKTLFRKVPRPAARPWPKWLRNIWAQNFGFLAIALFSALILTSPLVTALTLILFIVISLGVSLFFERKAFCRYLCPIGGFVGVYGQVAPVAVRVKDPAVCATHTKKNCFTGSDAGWGCPYYNLPVKVETNTLCSMCGECLRTCDKNNVAFYLQHPGKDLLNTRGRRLDEAFNGLMMLAAAFVYSVVLIGTDGWLKMTARAVGTPSWFAFAGVLLLFCGVLVPGLFWLCVRAGRLLNGRQAATADAGAKPGKKVDSLFAAYATALVPLGLAIWIALTLSFTLTNISYAWPALSDPFGWGWNLFGTADVAWTPYLSGIVSHMQIPVLIVGLVAAVALALRAAHQHGQRSLAAVPVSLFCALSVVVLLTLYMA
jgi:polyferredoxin